MNVQPGFSICVPNYNYASYLEHTIRSVLSQSYSDFEICMADNQSTDHSVDVARSFNDNRIKVTVNPVNVGFAGNLEVVSRMAIKEHCILLSSDDLMNAGALDFYQRFINQLNEQRFVFCSACNRVDTKGEILGYDGKRSKVWKDSDLDPELSAAFACPIYKVAAPEMLKRCLTSFYGYFNFASACYKRTDLEHVGGYEGSRLMNPDKWFHWKLLTVVDWVYFIDKPLFSYRWHNQNQTALQSNSGALKFFVDEYRSSFEIDEAFAAKANLTTNGVKASYVKNIIQKYTFKYLWQGDRAQAARIHYFGWSTYPLLMRSSYITWGLRLLIFLGPIGTYIVRRIRTNY